MVSDFPFIFKHDSVGNVIYDAIERPHWCILVNASRLVIITEAALLSQSELWLTSFRCSEKNNYQCYSFKLFP